MVRQHQPADQRVRGRAAGHPALRRAKTAVRLHMVDSLGCAAGGFGSAPVAVVEQLARDAVGRPRSRVLFYA
jgi:2-methylcitrate dehydratase PrpD